MIYSCRSQMYMLLHLEVNTELVLEMTSIYTKSE